MAKTISIDSKIIRDLVSVISELKREMAVLGEKFDIEPPYGSNDWWEWSDRKALEDIKAGRFTRVKSKKELHQFLDSLKAA